VLTLMRTAVGRFGIKSRGKEVQELLVLIHLENMLLLSHGKEVKVRK
jgi:hypothetical protein